MPQPTALCLSSPAPGQMGAAPHGGAVTGTMVWHLPVAESHKVKQSFLFVLNCSCVPVSDLCSASISPKYDIIQCSQDLLTCRCAVRH